MLDEYDISSLISSPAPDDDDETEYYKRRLSTKYEAYKKGDWDHLPAQ